MPSDVTSLERRGDGHRQQAVGEHEQDVRLRVRVGVAGARIGEVDHRDRCDLVEHHVAERPRRQLAELPDGRVLELRLEPQPDVRSTHRRDERDRHHGDADRGAERQRPLQLGMAEDVADGRLAIDDVRHEGEADDDDDVREHR
jgi:hypothetical protein